MTDAAVSTRKVTYTGKRLMDLTLTGAALLALSPVMLGVAAAVKLTSPGPALYWSDRVGAGRRNFRMPKFRTMRVGTPAVATHLLNDPNSWLTPIGGFLRRSSLDELPQLLSIMAGHMSIVGPRPALFNQHDLMDQRVACGVHELKPGITGWAQINGRDEISIPEKVKFDNEYATNLSFLTDVKIILLTVPKILGQSGVSH